ncbi:unnamed protein product [Prunus armeniaca]
MSPFDKGGGECTPWVKVMKRQFKFKNDVRPVLPQGSQENHGNHETERKEIVQREGDAISGPDGRSKPTPLSQIGFRDPASVGGGQQLTLLSVEMTILQISAEKIEEMKNLPF